MRTFFCLFPVLLFFACRLHKNATALYQPTKVDSSIHKFLNHGIYELYRKGYKTEYLGQYPLSVLVQIDENNVDSIYIDNNSKTIKLIPKNPHPEFVSAKTMLDAVESRTGSRNCLLVYNGVPYTTNLIKPFPIDSFKIEKTIYKGFITLNKFDSLPRSASDSGKIIFFVYPRNLRQIDTK